MSLFLFFVLVQSVEYFKVDYGERLTEMRELFQQLSFSVDQLSEKISEINRSRENKFSLSSIYTTFFEKYWPNRDSWIADIQSFVYSQWNSTNSAVVIMVMNGLFLVRVTSFRTESKKPIVFFFLVNIKIEILELALQTDRACVCVFPNVWTGFTDPTKAVGLALATTVRLVPRSISILH